MNMWIAPPRGMPHSIHFPDAPAAKELEMPV